MLKQTKLEFSSKNDFVTLVEFAGKKRSEMEKSSSDIEVIDEKKDEMNSVDDDDMNPEILNSEVSKRPKKD